MLNFEFTTIADRGEKCDHLYKYFYFISEISVAKANCQASTRSSNQTNV